MSWQIKHSIERNIKEYGFHIQYIMADQHSASLPFFYTIGLTDMGLPEILMVGDIPTTYGAQIIHVIVDEWKRRGFLPGIHNDYIQTKDKKPLPLQVRELDTSYPRLINHFTVFAHQRYEHHDNFRVAQLIWPDHEGRLPFDESYSMHHLQELLPLVKAKFEA